MKLRYAIGGILAAALLVVPVSAAARQGSGLDSLAAQHCAQERASIGKKAFHRKYGARHTMRTCVRRNRALVRQASQAAANQCQDELAQIGTANFIDEYGEDPSDSVDSAMAECVAEQTDEILDPDDSADDEIDDSL